MHSPTEYSAGGSSPATVLTPQCRVVKSHGQFQEFGSEDDLVGRHMFSGSGRVCGEVYENGPNTRQARREGFGEAEALEGGTMTGQIVQVLHVGKFREFGREPLDFGVEAGQSTAKAVTSA
jgi:hypothetical protein